jgi:hypothetical protein
MPATNSDIMHVPLMPKEASQMPVFEVIVETIGQEKYYIEAEDDQEARRKFDDGEETTPHFSEVLSTEIIGVLWGSMVRFKS